MSSIATKQVASMGSSLVMNLEGSCLVDLMCATTLAATSDGEGAPGVVGLGLWGSV